MTNETDDLVARVGIDESAVQPALSRIIANLERTQATINRLGDVSTKVSSQFGREQEKALNLSNRLLDQYDNKLAKIGGYDSELRRLNKTLADPSVAQHINANTQALLREQAALVDAGNAAKTHGNIFSSVFSGAALGGFVGGLAKDAASEALSAIKNIPGDAIAAGTALFDLAKASSDFGSAIFDTSQKTALSAKSLSTIKLAADISGASLDDFAGGFIKFEKNLSSAAHGNEELGKTFRALGIDVQAGVKDPEAALGQFLETFNQLPATADRAAIATTLYGKSGAQLIPTFLELGGNFDQAKSKAEALGLTFDSNAAAAADRFGDTLDTVKKQLTGVGYIIGQEFTPIFTDALSVASKALADNKDEIKRWATTAADLFDGVGISLKNQAQVTETTLDGVNNRLRDYGTSVTDIYNKLKVINALLPAALHTPFFDAADNVERATLAGAADRPRREALARAANARAQLEDNQINFATGKVVGGDQRDLSFLGGAADQARKAEEAVKKLGARQTEVIGEYRDLTTRANAENPFVKIYDEAAKAIAKVRVETRGVSRDTQELFDLQRQISSKALFSARLDSALGAYNLRDQAEQFRKGAPKEIDSRLLGDKDFLKIAQGLPDAKGFLGDNNQFKSEADRAGFTLKYLRGQIEDPNKALQDKIDRQIGIISDVQRTKGDVNTLGLADKSLIALTQGLKPEDLSSQQREVAASAREREATRFDKNEQTANVLRTRQTDSVERLSAKFDKLVQLAEDKGLKVLDASPDAGQPPVINVKVNGDGTTTQNAGRMPALSIPLTGGSNGLTNR